MEINENERPFNDNYIERSYSPKKPIQNLNNDIRKETGNDKDYSRYQIDNNRNVPVNDKDYSRYQIDNNRNDIGNDKDYSRYQFENNRSDNVYENDYSKYQIENNRNDNVYENQMHRKENHHKRENSFKNVRVQSDENFEAPYQIENKNVFKHNQYQKTYDSDDNRYDSVNFKTKQYSYPKENTVQMERKIYQRNNNEMINNNATSLENSISGLNINKINELEKQILNLTQKSMDLTKNIENIKQDKYRREDKYIYSDIGSDKIKQELSILRSDTIIFKEEINRLSEFNSHYEEELNRQRNRKYYNNFIFSLELAAENERLLQEKLIKQQEIEKLNIELVKSKGKESDLQENYTIRFNNENRMRELENEIKTLMNLNQKVEVDFKVISERFVDLKAKNDQTESEYQFLKIRQNEVISY